VVSIHTVYLVDDEQVIVQGIQKLIAWEELGIKKVCTFTNPLEALNVIQEATILLTDIRMPEMSGLDLIKASKEINRNIRCVILSSYDDFEYVRSALLLGASDYLLKPVNKEKLMTTLLGLIKKQEKDNAENPRELEEIYNSHDYNPIVKRTLDYMHAHYNTDLSLKQISAMFKIDPSYLGQVFRTEAGKLFSDYLNTIRVKKAMNMLSHTNLKLSEISSQVGYNSTSYFFKMFKKVAGISPTEYKHQKKT